MARGLDKLGMLRHGLAVHIARNIDTVEVTVFIDEYINLNASRTISQIEGHGKHAFAAFACGINGRTPESFGILRL